MYKVHHWWVGGLSLPSEPNSRSGHGKLRHKVGALLHQVKLEVGFNAPSLSAYLRNVVGICTDQGTESAIHEVPSLDLGKVLEFDALHLGK